MNKLFYMGLIAVIVLSAFPQAAGANLLSNSGFETWVDYGGTNVPADWMHIFSYASPTGTQETTVVKSGSSSGKIAVTDPNNTAWGGWFQEKPFTAGNTLYAYQPLNFPSGFDFTVATLKVTFKNAGGTILSTLRQERNTPTSGWEAISVSGVAPVDTTKIEYGVMMESWGSGPFAGTVYFDDAYADNVPIPEPASLLLLGMGLVGILAISRGKK